MISDYFPQAVGLLPKWQLFIAATAALNTLQNFITLKFTKRLYEGTNQVTSLQARTFAVWTLTAAVVRAYCAFHIHEKVIYDLTLFTYLFAFGHFSSELFIFRTARLNFPVMNPIVVSTLSLVWMIKQYDFYVKN
ncbi:Erg28-like protein [Mycena floridula]|nr:Erg28-like protein [Mycena floridula]